MAMKTLDELALLHGADKASTRHNYTVKYDRMLTPKRQSARKILEIGVAGGSSLKMWRDYFPNAQVYGMDINPDCARHAGERITVIIGDQGNRMDLAKLAEKGPFDLILDDGSHFYPHQITSFEALWDSVIVSGLYIVEDIFTSYWQGWGEGITAVDYFRRVVDYVNFMGTMTPDLTRRESLIVPMLAGKANYPTNIQSVAFYNGFIVLEKNIPTVIRRPRVK